MSNVHEENKCSDLRAKFNDLRDKFYQLKLARSTSTHFLTPTHHIKHVHTATILISDNNCPSWGQFSNYSYEQMNTNFFNLGCDLNSNFYNSDWSNQTDFSWPAQAT
jgi:hypothetical protein